MAKEKENKDERQALWEEYVEAYKARNPVKGAAKEARGEFKTPPASFQGLKRSRQLANGKVVVDIY